MFFLRLLKGKREVPGAAEKQKTLARAARQVRARLRADGRHLRAGGRPSRAARKLCRRCDCHSEKTLRESAQPTSLESRVAPGVMEQYARSPKLPAEVVCSVRSSSSKLDGAGADFSQAFADEGGSLFRGGFPNGFYSI